MKKNFSIEFVEPITLFLAKARKIIFFFNINDKLYLIKVKKVQIVLNFNKDTIGLKKRNLKEFLNL